MNYANWRECKLEEYDSQEEHCCGCGCELGHYHRDSDGYAYCPDCARQEREKLEAAQWGLEDEDPEVFLLQTEIDQLTFEAAAQNNYESLKSEAE